MHFEKGEGKMLGATNLGNENSFFKLAAPRKVKVLELEEIMKEERKNLEDLFIKIFYGEVEVTNPDNFDEIIRVISSIKNGATKERKKIFEYLEMAGDIQNKGSNGFILGVLMGWFACKKADHQKK